MNKEQAIEIIETHSENISSSSLVGRALDIAIDALKAQLSQEDTTSDLIGRQWLMECVNEGWIKFDTDKDANRFIHLVRDIAPSAQPEPQEGHWIQYDKRFPWRHHYKCSVCGNYLDFTGVNGGRGEANYCPNCGAKMKGERQK